MNLGNKATLRSVRLSVRRVCSFKAFWSDKRAVSAVEFAMILPFMLLILIGMEVITGALNQDRKISRIASSITDLVAQEQTVTTGGLDAVMQVGDAILAPNTDPNLEIIVASVAFDEDGDASVVWSRDSKKSTAWSAGSPPPITLPSTIAIPNTSIVVGQANLAYTPLFADLYSYIASQFAGQDMGTINLSDTYFLRPRLTDTVTCDNCPSS